MVLICSDFFSFREKLIHVFERKIVCRHRMTWYHLEYTGDIFDLDDDFKYRINVVCEDEDALWSEASMIVHDFVYNIWDMDFVQQFVDDNVDDVEDYEEETMDCESDEDITRTIMWYVITDRIKVVKGFQFSPEFENTDTYNGF